jgi:uncharacterized protein (TIGR01319 family)
MNMNDIKLLIDFGSTFTKVAAVDLKAEEVIATARVPSTVETDITVGLEQALENIADKAGICNLDRKEALACSSAAGGLRMVCIGFVPELTSKAANYAALGAGAKVVRCYSYKLTRQEIKEIEAISPDIVLLSGGTDGGDEQVIIHNARMLSGCDHDIKNILVAGNKTAYDEIEAIFSDNERRVLFTRNVMPEIGVLDVAPCNKEIRDIFIKNIIQAKGIDKARAIISEVIMPTPAAVLEAAKLIAGGCGNTPGLGELMVIDPGGATTDVHSVATGNPNTGGVILASTLPEPNVKRTVEGNLGLKYNIDTLRELVEGRENSPAFDKIIQRFHEGELPRDEEEIACHLLLSRLAVEVAVNQHVGRIDVVYGPTGEMLVQHGKDLTQVKVIIGTGGPIIDSSNPRAVLDGALFQQEKPTILKPKEPKFYLDQRYILYAVGLLSQVEPRKGLNLALKYLKQI